MKQIFILLFLWGSIISLSFATEVEEEKPTILSGSYDLQDWLLYSKDKQGKTGLIQLFFERKSRVVNGKEYSIFRLSGDLIEKKEILCRQENGKIFTYSEERQGEELIIDYSLTPGEQFTRPNGDVMIVMSVRDTMDIFCFGTDLSYKVLVLQEAGNPGNEDVWIEGVGSLKTAILPCNICSEINLKLIACTQSGALVYFPIDEENMKSQWTNVVEVDDSKAPQIQCEFVSDTLHIFGYVRQWCSGTPPIMCQIDGANVKLNLLPAFVTVTSCLDTNKIDLKFPGFKQGTYHVTVDISYDVASQYVITCNPSSGIHTPADFLLDKQIHTIYDLSGRRLNSVPAKGMYIRGGKKVLVK